MDIWLILLKILIGVISFFGLIMVMVGIEWAFEKFLNSIEGYKVKYVINIIFRILEIVFVVLGVVMLIILVIYFVYDLGDVLWKLI